MTLQEAIIIINQIEIQVKEAGFGSLDGLMQQQWLDASTLLRDYVRKLLSAKNES